jgi:PAS domain S-box-containing protein
MTEHPGSLEVLGEAGFRALVYRTLIENLEHGVFVLDTKLRYRAINRRLALWLGLRAEDVLGRTAFELYPRPQADRYAADLQRVLHGKRVERVERHLVGGASLALHLVALPLRNEDGAALGLLALCRNLCAWDGRQGRMTMADAQVGVSPSAAEQVGKLSGQSPRPMRRETLLLVDREPTLRTLFQMILQKEGYRVLLANNAGQALRVLRDSSVPIRLLILEHASARTGGGTLSDLRTLWPWGRILLIGEDGLANHCQLPPQVRGLLSKPFRPELLVRAVHEILGSEEGSWEEAAADGRGPKSPPEENGQSMSPLQASSAEVQDLERLIADLGNVYGVTFDEVGWTWKTTRSGGRANRQ